MKRTTYELPCQGDQATEFVVREIAEPLRDLGYVIDAKAGSTLTLLGLRRPRWAIALAVFLFPVGLLLLLIKRPREARLAWRGGQAVALELISDDRAVRHRVASVAAETARPPTVSEKVAAPFAAGAGVVLAAWLIGVQLVDGAAAFAIVVFLSAVLGSGAGTLVGLRRLSRYEDPPDPFVWGTLPAFAGGLAMACVFVLLVLFLVAVGAGD